MTKDMLRTTGYHGLNQQGIWASFGHPNPLKPPIRTPIKY